MSTPGLASAVERMDMFEVYDSEANLLLVTSDVSAISDLQPGDTVYRRSWSTDAEAVLYHQARARSIETGTDRG